VDLAAAEAVGCSLAPSLRLWGRFFSNWQKRISGCYEGWDRFHPAERDGPPKRRHEDDPRYFSDGSWDKSPQPARARATASSGGALLLPHPATPMCCRYLGGFEQYYNPSLGARQWLPASSHAPNCNDKQLVAQLDQMNTYLVLLTPRLPDSLQGEWRDSLLRLCDAMINQFYSPGERLFFRSSNRPEDKALPTSATDFGHNAKALWMIRWTEFITGRPHLVAFAEDNACADFPGISTNAVAGPMGSNKVAPWMWTKPGGYTRNSTNWWRHWFCVIRCSHNTYRERMTIGSVTSSTQSTERYGTRQNARSGA
jgi:hypothetical protein